MDLLTVVRHEVGHVLGYEHGDGLMAPTLAAGELWVVPTTAPAPPAAESLAAPATESNETRRASV